VSIAGFWIILWWVIMNFLGAVTGYTGGTAYFAHIGGFVAGLVSAIILVAGKMVIRDSDNEAIVRALNV
jgi:membrane associated rhomboid family serine protease